ncbi:response regulator [Candidatus Parcubacteria bacterium]|nr:MAG: response regulator [Candidatus Parcubacteria bacterium]
MPDHNKIKVLIVDDEIAITKALSLKLAKENFEVVVAHNGQEGVELAQKERPDVILMDIIMPKLDGLSAAKQIRNIKGWGEDVPIIMLTNLGDPENVAEAGKFGIFDYLVKTDWKLDDVVKFIYSKVGQ